MARSVKIPLEIWQDPQGDVLLVYSEAECSVYFACWNEPGVSTDFIGHLTFEKVCAVRSFPREYLPYQPEPSSAKSSVIQVFDSELAAEHLEYRKRHYPNFIGAAPNHFVVPGHDIYHEILADRFNVATILREGITDPRLLRL
jgi:hypothetical protein